MIYFISDTHFNHANLVSATTKWSDNSKTRQFSSLEEHNVWLINSINSIVRHDDELYHLGDWSFGGKDKIKTFRDQLNCRKIHIICGNHDHHIHQESHGDLFESITPYLCNKLIKVNSQTIILGHHAMRTWYKDNKGSWMLYGHSHGTLNDNYPELNRRTIDVGVDNLMKIISRPVISFTELNTLFVNRQVKQIDHHNESTNAD